eukprot:1832971-Alexandrium_andersonii.AAC.1
MKDAFAYLSSVTIRHCVQGLAALRERAELTMVAAVKVVSDHMSEPDDLLPSLGTSEEQTAAIQAM